MMDESYQGDREAIRAASLYFNELYKKTALRNASSFGVTKTQLDILFILEIEGSMKMSDLSDRLIIAREQATRSVHSLKEKSLVESIRPQQNRKHVVAMITSKGEKLLADYKKSSDKLLGSYLDRLSLEDRTNLIAHSKAAADILHRNNFS